MTAPTRPGSPGLAYAAFAVLLAGTGAAGWYRSAWPLLVGLLAFLILALVATQPKAHP